MRTNKLERIRGAMGGTSERGDRDDAMKRGRGVEGEGVRGGCLGLFLGLFWGSSWGVRGGIFVRKYQGIVCRKLHLTANNRSDLSPAQIWPVAGR